MTSVVVCPNCDNANELWIPNYYGHKCSYCQYYIRPESEPPFVKENQLKLKHYQEIARNLLREKIKKESQMPINASETKITMEFVWQSEHDVDDKIYVQYEIIDDVPFVNFSLDREDWYKMPMAFFEDVVSYIHNKQAQIHNSQSPKIRPRPDSFTRFGSEPKYQDQVESKRGSVHLPLPSVTKMGDSEVNEERSEDTPIDTGRSLQSISGLGISARSLTRPSPKNNTQLSEQEIEEMKSRPVVKRDDPSSLAARQPNMSRSIRRS